MITIKTMEGKQRLKGKTNDTYIVVGMNENLIDVQSFWCRGGDLQRTYDYLITINNVYYVRIAVAVSTYLDAK